MYYTPYSSFMQGMNYGQQPPSLQPPQIPAQTQPQPSEVRRTNAEFIPVSSVQQVREHIVQPGQTLYFMNNNVTEFYVKTADNFGTTQLKAFSFAEINPDAPAIAAQLTEDAVTRGEFDALRERLDAFERKLAPAYTRKEKHDEPVNENK